MAKTRMMTRKGECYLCGALGQTEEHHCFGGPNRRFSEKYGLKVYLCIPCHRTGPNAVHDSMNGNENRQILHEDAQKAFEATGGQEDTSWRSSAATTWMREKDDTSAD